MYVLADVCISGCLYLWMYVLVDVCICECLFVAVYLCAFVDVHL